MDIRDLEFGRFERLGEVVHGATNTVGGSGVRSLGSGLVEHTTSVVRPGKPMEHVN